MGLGYLTPVQLERKIQQSFDEDKVTTNQLKELGDQLRGSLALNTLSQTIIKLDVAIEGLQRLMDDIKRVQERLENTDWVGREDYK